MIDSAVNDEHVNDDELLKRFPNVRLDHDNKHYYRSLLRRELRLNRCRACRRWHGPPLRPMCPDCWSFDIAPEVINGAGHIVLVTHLHQGPPADDVTYDPPYPLVAVELIEQAGLRISAGFRPAEGVMAIPGLQVHLAWVTRGGNPTPIFEPALSNADRANVP